MQSASKCDVVIEQEEQARNLRRAVVASVFGSTLEYYDFALYGMASALIFGRLFFPSLGTSAGIVASYAAFAVGFVIRPLGGIVFGVLGDRYGRKFVLIATVSLMGMGSTLIGLLPTGRQVGYLAPVLLVLLRVVQGFGAGAEQAGVACMMAEYAPRDRRGRYTALPFVGIPGGLLLASAVYVLLGSADPQVMLAWLWRVPFLCSGILLLVAVYVRYGLQETPAFRTLSEEGGGGRPLRDLFRRSSRNLLRGIGLRVAENGNSYIFYTLTLSYMTAVTGLSAAQGALGVALGCVVGIPAVIFFGDLSDRVGRMPVYRYACLGMLLFAAPSWWLLSLGDAAVSIAVVATGIGIGIFSMLGPQVSCLPELFGNSDRVLAVSVCREFSSVIAGGFAPLIGSLLLAASGNAWWSIAGYAALLSGVGYVTTLFTPETRGRDLTLLHDARPGEERWTRPVPDRTESQAVSSAELAS